MHINLHNLMTLFVMVFPMLAALKFTSGVHRLVTVLLNIMALIIGYYTNAGFVIWLIAFVCLFI